jgi:hypothetical protein
MPAIRARRARSQEHPIVEAAVAGMARSHSSLLGSRA